MNSAFLCLMNGKSKNFCGDKIPTVHKTHSKHQEESLLQEEDSMSTSRQTIELAQVTNSALEVLNSDGNRVKTQIVPVDDATKRVRNFYTQDISAPAGPLFNLFFEASVPALGCTVYFLKAAKDGASRTSFEKPEHINGEVILDSNRTQMVFSNSTGSSIEIRDPEHRVSSTIHQTYCWYNGSDGNTTKRMYETSGAYVFRPNNTRCFPVGTSSKKGRFSG